MKIREVLTRIFLNSSELDHHISFYENLCGEKCDLRFKYYEQGLELAVVSSFLLISGTDEHLKPFKETAVTCLVDSLDDFKTFLMKEGVTILAEPKVVPTGRNMRAKHKDGLVVEYVEYATKA